MFKKLNEQLEKFMEQEINDLGTPVVEFSNGVINYEKEIVFPKNEVIRWCTLWDSVICNRFKRQYPEFKYNYELDRKNGSITVWVSDMSKYDQGLGKIPGKLFFDIKIEGKLVTSVYPDGKQKPCYSPDDNKITFSLSGTKI